MPRRRDSYQIQKELDIAKARETFKKNDRLNNPKPYAPRPDLTTVYYRDFTTANKLISLQASDLALTAIGGLSAVGLLGEPPAGSIPISVRGLNYPIVKIHWFYGDATPQAKVTGWGSRYIKYHDNNGGQSHFSLPISVDAGAFTLATIIGKFEALFNPVDGTKKDLLGRRGKARLAIGRETIMLINP